MRIDVEDRSGKTDDVWAFDGNAGGDKWLVVSSCWSWTSRKFPVTSGIAAGISTANAARVATPHFLVRASLSIQSVAIIAAKMARSCTACFTLLTLPCMLIVPSLYMFSGFANYPEE
jgi:hypothetical protein